MVRNVIPGRRHKRVYARLRRAMAAGAESIHRSTGDKDSGFAAKRPRPGMTKYPARPYFFFIG